MLKLFQKRGGMRRREPTTTREFVPIKRPTGLTKHFPEGHRLMVAQGVHQSGDRDVKR